MKLTIGEQNLVSRTIMVSLDHKGETIDWNVSVFEKMSGGVTNYDIFQHINEFWQHMPENKQDQLFQIYKNIRLLFDSLPDFTTLTIKLKELLVGIYNIIDIQSIRHWIDFYSDIALPSSLKEEFVEQQSQQVDSEFILEDAENEDEETQENTSNFKRVYEMTGTREKTYLREDYKGLIALTIALRPMIPIWGEYMWYGHSALGTVFKEEKSFELLDKSHAIFHSEQMEQLRLYVEHSIPQDKSKSSAIIHGVGTFKFTDWMLGLVVVRRLSVGDIRGLDPNANMITFIFKYIQQKTKAHDSSFVGTVKDKIVENQGQESESNLSRLEGYKIKQEVPAGDICVMSYYIQHPHQVAQKLCPDIPLHLVDESLESVRVLEHARIHVPQERLCQQVLYNAMPGKGILHLKKPDFIRAIAVAQAVLWHRGHKELAALVSAQEQEEIDDLFSGSDSRSRIPKELLEELDLFYPFSKKPPGRQRIVKRVNPAVENIDFFTQAFSSLNWKLTLPDYWIEQVTGQRGNRRFVIPTDFKIKLAQFAIAFKKGDFGSCR